MHRLKLDQAKRLKELERENARLKRAVADLTLDKLIHTRYHGRIPHQGNAMLARTKLLIQWGAGGAPRTTHQQFG